VLADYTQNGKTGFCLENATMFQIQGMFENGKSDIVLKTDMGRDPKHPVFQFVPISYGPSVRFGPNVSRNDVLYNFGNPKYCSKNCDVSKIC